MPRPAQRCLTNGILVVDKPAGMSSAQAVNRLKQTLGPRKIGHAGTLDPFATGVLILCLNRATRLARFLLQGNKTYEATLRLGVETDTQDVTGKTIAEHTLGRIDETDIRAVMQRFKGSLRQVPPAYSALKHQGVPLYKLARSGKPVQKPAREVTISCLTLLGIELPEIRFGVRCGPGTYIRTLGADIGKALGCGGHLTALRRTESCGFQVAEALKWDLVTDQDDPQPITDRIIGMAKTLNGLPSATADGRLAAKIAHGRTVIAEDLGLDGCPSGWIKVVDRDQHLLAILEYDRHRQKFNYGCSFIDQSYITM